jgi:transposase
MAYRATSTAEPRIVGPGWCRSKRVDDRLNRHDLTDEEWQRLLPMMPADARRGRRWSDHRMVINGIMFRTRTGCPWRDLPGEYGNWKTACNRHRRWSLDGTWEKILAPAAGRVR